MAALRHGPGLLDGEAVYRIARSLLIGGRESAIWDRRLLTSRCLYACTLTNLTSLTADSRKSFGGVGDASLPGLRDALVSRFHHDIRIFDIHFDQTLQKEHADESVKKANKLASTAALGPDAGTVTASTLEAPTLPPRWFRIHDGNNVDDVALSIHSDETWATFASTAIASGAFPAAFPPVVITRKSWEYGYRPKDQNAEALNEASTWPKRLKQVRAEQHPLAYVDGGVFNNDPVREAFRMVSFLDGHATSNDFVRRVLFVDPSVGPEVEHFRVQALEEFDTEEKAGIFNAGTPEPTRQLTTLPRLMGMVGGLISIVLDQGRSREADGIMTTRDNFALRERFRIGAQELLGKIPSEALRVIAEPFWSQLNKGCNLIFVGWANQSIPVGSANVAGELRRILREENLSAEMIVDATGYVENGPQHSGLRGAMADWLFVHLALYFDLVLGLEGKRESARLIAITPYQNIGKENPIPLKLLGEPMAAFFGFLSLAAREHDFLAGRFCADLFLDYDATTVPAHKKSAGPRLLPQEVAGRITTPPERGKELRDTYTRQLREWAPRLRERLEQVLEDGLPGLFSPFVPWVLKKLVDLDDSLDGIVKERFSTESPRQMNLEAMSVEVMLLVPPELTKLEIAGSGHGMRDEPVRQIRIFGQIHSILATRVRFDPETATWYGGAVRDGNHLRLDKDGLNFGHWARVQLPIGHEWRELFDQGQTHLRPVLKLDIRGISGQGGHALPTGTIKWVMAEAAVPLVDTLLKKPTASLVASSMDETH